MAKLSQAKAEEMLHNPPHGKPLSDKQRKYFGAIASGKTDWLKKYDDGGVQENYNSSKITTPPEYVGLGNLDTGFNYNSAWGGRWENGGIMPGANGFQYARHGAPSKGPHGKKTVASAEDGASMRYFQNGLDFNPKMISADGTEVKADATRVAPRQPLDYAAIQQAQELKDYKLRKEYNKLYEADKRTKPSWWNAPVSGVNFTPEQRSYELQRRAQNIVEDEYTPWEEKAKTAALDIGLSVIPELGGAKIFSAMKGAPKIARNIGEVAGETGELLGKGAKEMADFYGDAFKYSKLGQKFDEIPRSLEEIREYNRIKDRVKNSSLTDLIEWKKGRMLSREAPNYNWTYNDFGEAIDQGAKETAKDIDRLFGGSPIDPEMVKVGHAPYIEKAYEKFDMLRPTNSQYRQKVKNPFITIDEQIEKSYANPYGINIGLKPNPGEADIPFQLGTVRNHELDHYVSYPTVHDDEAFRTFMDFKHSNPYYTGKNMDRGTKEAFNNVEDLVYMDKKGTEIKARLGQLKDFLGFQGAEEMSMPQLRAALKAAGNQEKMGMFNNMLDTNPIWNSEIPVFRRVTDKKKMLQYMNDVRTNPKLTAHKDGGVVKAKEGASLQLDKLDQLTNFTNYNKPTRGGWLDKYK